MTSRMTFLAFLLLICPVSSMAGGFSEHFGDSVATVPACPAQWYSQCETDVTAYGAASSVDLCDDGTNYYASFKPGNGAGSNVGLGASFALDPLDLHVETVADLEIKAANSSVAIQLIFKDSSGNTISTETKSKTFTNTGLVTLVVDYVIPSGAATSSLAKTDPLLLARTDPP